MRRTLLALVALGSILAACTPAGTTSSERVEVEQLTEPITYYPYQTGARWQYLPDGARLSDPTTALVVEGPTIVDNEVWLSWHMRGRGLDQRSYRQVRGDGVFLKQEERLGTVFTFDPPLQEYPPQSQMRVGAQWRGTTTVHMSAEEGKQQRDLVIDYVYTVVDQRSVNVPAGAFDVFVIDFTTRTTDENGTVTEELTQQSWFAPYVGEVRTRNGHVLVDSNVVPEDREGEADGGS